MALLQHLDFVEDSTITAVVVQSVYNFVCIGIICNRKSAWIWAFISCSSERRIWLLGNFWHKHQFIVWAHPTGCIDFVKTISIRKDWKNRNAKYALSSYVLQIHIRIKCKKENYIGNKIISNTLYVVPQFRFIRFIGSTDLRTLHSALANDVIVLNRVGVLSRSPTTAL